MSYGYKRAWYNSEAAGFAAVALVCVLLFTCIGGAGLLWNKRECRVYGEETQRETKYRMFRGGCYVKLDRGWRRQDEVHTREVDVQ